MIGSGKIKARTITTFPLREAAQVHRQLESGKTGGSVILVP
jgi:NADPH:quinone reductase-like Zn-dependent oxidoreductase